MAVGFRFSLFRLFAVTLVFMIWSPRASKCFLEEMSLQRRSNEKTFCELCRTSHDDFSISDPSITRSSFLSSITTIVVASVAQPPTANAAENPTSSGKVGDDSTSRGRALQESFSGSIAGIALATSKTLIKYPLDSATVRLQMPDSKYTIFDLPTLLNGSYKGVQVPLVNNIPSAAVFFAVKDACKEYLRPLGMPRWFATSVAVLTAQFPYWLVRNPSEVAKTRSQAGVPGYGDASSPWQAFLQVGKDANSTQNGTGLMNAYYVGYWENIIYAYPADVLKFIVYEQFSGGRKNLPPAEGAVLGAAATAVAQLITTPLDVVRNRLMMKENTNSMTPSANAGSGYWQTLKQLAKQEGLSGLFAGAAPRVGKALLSGAIQFATYEETKQQLAKAFGSDNAKR